jgi:gamma-glutamyl-gamma-aminobutyrate hydrolase PuuD
MSFNQHVDSHEMTNRFHLFRSSAHHYVNSRVDILYGEKQEKNEPIMIPVNSMHHQAVYLELKPERLEKTIRISAHAHALAWTQRGLDTEEDGVVCEAMLIKGWTPAPILGVQWHPEELQDHLLIRNFFENICSAPKPQKAAIGK